MPETCKLRLELVDVFGDRVGEPVDIQLFNQGLSERRIVRAADARRVIEISGLVAPPNGLYRVEIDPPSFMPVNRFVNLRGAMTALNVVMAVDPAKVIRPVFPDFAKISSLARDLLKASASVLGFNGKSGAALYEGLDDIRRAGFLNIAAKALRTCFADKRPVLSFVHELQELRGDRFFARVSHELREATKNSVAAGLFEPVSGALHRPPDGFSSAGSFKTHDPFGNLQLSFFSNGTDWVADIDVDDANGFAHVFQVLRNTLTGRPTHPYDIHQILMASQEIDAGYRFVLHETPAVSAVRRSAIRMPRKNVAVRSGRPTRKSR